MQTGAVLYFNIPVDAFGTMVAPAGPMGRDQFLAAWKSVNDSLEVSKDVSELYKKAFVLCADDQLHIFWGNFRTKFVLYLPQVPKATIRSVASFDPVRGPLPLRIPTPRNPIFVP